MPQLETVLLIGRVMRQARVVVTRRPDREKRDASIRKPDALFHSYAVAFAVFSFVAKWYLWPAIKDRAPKIALTPLLLYACLRVNGLMFLMPGLVSPELPGAFAVPTAYGDLTAVALALLALICVRTENAAATPMVWLFNIVGLLD